MKMFKRYIAFVLLLCPVVVFAAANDNKILLDQSGDTLKLYIDQIGYGNKLCGTISSADCATDWILTGSANTIDIDMLGNLNQIFGPILVIANPKFPNENFFRYPMSNAKSVEDPSISSLPAPDGAKFCCRILKLKPIDEVSDNVVPKLAVIAHILLLNLPRLQSAQSPIHSCSPKFKKIICPPIVPKLGILCLYAKNS